MRPSRVHLPECLCEIWKGHGALLLMKSPPITEADSNNLSHFAPLGCLAL